MKVRRVVVQLPFPPSTNGLWRRGKTFGGKRNMHLSPEYRRWRSVANLMLTAQWPALQNQKIAGNFTCEIVLNKSLRVGIIDADNRIKPVLDILQSSGLIENDAKANKVSVEWGDVHDCVVTLRGKE